MLSNRSVPRATVIPELGYPNLGEAIDWLTSVFGFMLRIRIGEHRAQLNVGDGAVVLTEQGPGRGNQCAVMVRVENAHHHHARAKDSGANILRPPADYPYGERQYTAQDFAGHIWTFTESIADVDPRDWGGTPGEL